MSVDVDVDVDVILDLRSIYLIHRNGLGDHNISFIDLIPRFSDFLEDQSSFQTECKKVSKEVIHYAVDQEQNTWRLYHTKLGCIMEYWWVTDGGWGDDCRADSG